MVLDKLRDKLGLKNELARALLGEFTGTLLLLVSCLLVIYKE